MEDFGFWEVLFLALLFIIAALLVIGIGAYIIAFIAICLPTIIAVWIAIEADAGSGSLVIAIIGLVINIVLYPILIGKIWDYIISPKPDKPYMAPPPKKDSENDRSDAHRSVARLEKNDSADHNQENAMMTSEDTKAVKVCKECGAVLPDDALYCGECGHPVNEPMAASETTDDTNNNKFKMSIALLVMVLIIVLFIVVMADGAANEDQIASDEVVTTTVPDEVPQDDDEGLVLTGIYTVGEDEELAEGLYDIKDVVGESGFSIEIYKNKADFKKQYDDEDESLAIQEFYADKIYGVKLRKGYILEIDEPGAVFIPRDDSINALYEDGIELTGFYVVGDDKETPEGSYNISHIEGDSNFSIEVYENKEEFKKKYNAEGDSLAILDLYNDQAKGVKLRKGYVIDIDEPGAVLKKVGKAKD